MIFWFLFLIQIYVYVKGLGEEWNSKWEAIILCEN
jgi:hypothetical protein